MTNIVARLGVTFRKKIDPPLAPFFPLVFVCDSSTAFIYWPILMKVVSIDSWYPWGVSSRLRIFQGANRFPPTGGNAWGRGGQVWEKCIWQKIYSDKYCSTSRGYPLKKNFWPPLAPPFPPRKDLPPAHDESPQTLFSNRFWKMISQMMWNSKFLFSSSLHFFEGCTPSPQGGNAWGRGGNMRKMLLTENFYLQTL